KQDNTNLKRLLDAKEVCIYTSMGRNSCRAFCENIGAVRKIGKRVLFDRVIIDKALDLMGEPYKE
ncbi:hypothetical protein UYO_2958, partial [Lachnospiraceae bacterium JC7]